MVRTALCALGLWSSLAAGVSGALARPTAHAAPAITIAAATAATTSGQRRPVTSCPCCRRSSGSPRPRPRGTRPPGQTALAPCPPLGVEALPVAPPDPRPGPPDRKPRGGG